MCRATVALDFFATYGVRAVDVFYVKDVFGLKVENERKLASLRGAMELALAPPPGEGGGTGTGARIAAARA